MKLLLLGITFSVTFYFSETGGDDEEDESYVHPFQPPKGKPDKLVWFKGLARLWSRL